MSESGLLLEADSLDVRLPVVSFEGVFPMNGLPEAGAILERQDLTRAIDWHSEVRIVRSTPPHELVFGGLVTSVLLVGTEAAISVVQGIQYMKEQLTGGFCVDAPSADVLHSMMRMTGWPGDLNLEGFRGFKRQIYEVVVPVHGVRFRHPTTFQGIQFSSNRAIPQSAGSYCAELIGDLFHDADAWAVAVVTADLLWEADTVGRSLIARAVDWLAVVAAYAGSQTPSGDVRPYDRRWTLTHPRIGDAVLVRALDTGHRLMRRTDAPRYREQLVTYEEIMGADGLSILDVPRQLSLATSSLRRSLDSIEWESQVVELWNGIEFYAAGHSLPSIATRAERGALEDAVAGCDVPAAVKDRAVEVLRRMNELSLMARLRGKLEVDGVPFSEKELARLLELRNKRNELVHGRYTQPPSTDAVRFGQSFLNRMLVYAAWKATMARSAIIRKEAPDSPRSPTSQP